MKEREFVGQISVFDVFSVTLFIPIGLIARIFWNGKAGRAINPFNKRFISTAVIVVIGSVLAVVWYFFIMPTMQYTFITGWNDLLNFSLSSVLEVGILMIFSSIALLLSMVAMAFPAGLLRTLKSFYALL